jgi:hypothetical protein
MANAAELYESIVARSGWRHASIFNDKPKPNYTIIGWNREDNRTFIAKIQVKIYFEVEKTN